MVEGTEEEMCLALVILDDKPFAGDDPPREGDNGVISERDMVVTGFKLTRVVVIGGHLVAGFGILI
jgi:hypothetical protein